MNRNPELEIRYFRPNTGERGRINRWSEWEFVQSLDGQSGTGALRLRNVNNRFFDSIGQFRLVRGDYIMFHLREEATGDEFYDDAFDLAFIGRVQSVSDKLNPTRDVELELADSTYEMMSNAFAFSATGTSPDLVSKLIEEFSGDGAGQGRIIVSPTNFPSLRPDGSAFPEITYASQKRVSEIISELLQPFATNTVSEILSGTSPAPLPYRYYMIPRYNNNLPLNVQFLLNVEYPSSVIDATIDLRSDRYVSFSSSDSNPERIIAVSWTAGPDLKGNSVRGLYFSPILVTDGRTVFKPFTEVSERRFYDEVRAGNIVENASGTIYRGNKRYTTDSFPLTPSWSSSPVADFDAYNDSFISIVETDANGIALQYITHKSFVDFEVELVGSLSYAPGNTVAVVNKAGKAFVRRVTKVLHRYNKDTGWTVRLTLEQDRQPVGVV